MQGPFLFKHIIDALNAAEQAVVVPFSLLLACKFLLINVFVSRLLRFLFSIAENKSLLCFAIEKMVVRELARRCLASCATGCLPQSRSKVCVACRRRRLSTCIDSTWHFIRIVRRADCRVRSIAARAASHSCSTRWCSTSFRSCSKWAWSVAFW